MTSVFVTIIQNIINKITPVLFAFVFVSTIVPRETCQWSGTRTKLSREEKTKREEEFSGSLYECLVVTACVLKLHQHCGTLNVSSQYLDV